MTLKLSLPLTLILIFIGLFVNCSNSQTQKVVIADLNQPLSYEVTLKDTRTGISVFSVVENTCPDTLNFRNYSLMPYQTGEFSHQCIPGGVEPYKATYTPPAKRTSGKLIFKFAFYPSDWCID
jgi:hypothetical protein